ncbi:hypothetical protein ACVWXO_000562 [Bradyrhizobium sp. LM2.7]
MSARRSHSSRCRAIPYRRLDVAWGGLLRQSPVNCGATRPPRGGGLEYRATTVQWHADRSARRPKPDQACAQCNLAHLCGGKTCWRRCSPERRARSWSPPFRGRATDMARVPPWLTAAKVSPCRGDGSLNMSAKDYADDLSATVRYALETTRAIAVCPFHSEVSSEWATMRLKAMPSNAPRGSSERWCELGAEGSSESHTACRYGPSPATLARPSGSGSP